MPTWKPWPTRTPPAYNRYGSTAHKQAYVYGGLDPRPRELAGWYGTAWRVGGRLMATFLREMGPARAAELQARIAAALKTTFASHCTRTVSLADALKPEHVQAYIQR